MYEGKSYQLTHHRHGAPAEAVWREDAEIEYGGYSQGDELRTFFMEESFAGKAGRHTGFGCAALTSSHARQLRSLAHERTNVARRSTDSPHARLTCAIWPLRPLSEALYGT